MAIQKKTSKSSTSVFQFAVVGKGALENIKKAKKKAPIRKKKVSTKVVDPAERPLETHVTAAVVIQRAWRLHAQSVAIISDMVEGCAPTPKAIAVPVDPEERPLETLANSAIIIQRWWKSLDRTSRVVEGLPIPGAAARSPVVESNDLCGSFMKNLVVKAVRSSVENRAAVVIQSNWVGYAARKEMLSLRAAVSSVMDNMIVQIELDNNANEVQKSAIHRAIDEETLEANAFIDALLVRVVRESTRTAAAITLQKLWRGYAVRREMAQCQALSVETIRSIMSCVVDEVALNVASNAFVKVMPVPTSVVSSPAVIEFMHASTLEALATAVASMATDGAVIESFQERQAQLVLDSMICNAVESTKSGAMVEAMIAVVVNQLAATKIQALWRGYSLRSKLRSPSFVARVILDDLIRWSVARQAIVGPVRNDIVHVHVDAAAPTTKNRRRGFFKKVKAKFQRLFSCHKRR